MDSVQDSQRTPERLGVSVVWVDDVASHLPIHDLTSTENSFFYDEGKLSKVLPNKRATWVFPSDLSYVFDYLIWSCVEDI